MSVWPILWGALVSWGMLYVFHDVPLGLKIVIVVGIFGGFIVASNNWETEACNCDDPDCEN